MRVGCLIPYPLGRVPSQRFRLEQWAPLLAREGIHLDFFPFLGERAFSLLYEPGHFAAKLRGMLLGYVGRVLWVLRSAAEYDVVVIHREATPFAFDIIDRWVLARRPTVFDFDDAIWLPNVSDENRNFGFLKGFSKVNRILRGATAVAAGSPYLAEHARQFSRQVAVVPTSIEMDAYSPLRRHEATDPLVVGWTGSLTTGAYLRSIGPALRRAAETINFRLVVYGARVELPGVEMECQPWDPGTELEVLRRFDVGLKPVPLEDWVLGKCPMKELQYMALGIPPVATRFGSAVDAIRQGETGWLCSTDDDWVAALAALRDPALRQRLGAAARLVVEEHYSSARAAASFAASLRTAASVFGERR